MKVAKFGGSSLADAKQIKKVSQIIKNDPKIRIVVVSAPGKRSDDDIKVTDLLIALYSNHMAGLDTEEAIQTILNRYQAIVDGLSIETDLIEKFSSILHSYLTDIKQADRLLDALKACGENFNAQLISAYFNQVGIPTDYFSPKDVGMIVTDEPGNAQLLESSYEQIAKIRNHDKVIIVPGFFGYSKNGDIVTFSRGGSDISGAIIARGVDAEIYENFTDVSYIYSAHPGIVRKPYHLDEITYREMRELSYSGFGVFHDEAIAPLYHHRTPIMIKNTNEPEVRGTKIVPERPLNSNMPVVGIAGDEGFTSITISKYLLNRETGFARRLLQIFEDLGVSIEHMPTGIDDISVIVRTSRLEAATSLEIIKRKIQEKLKPDTISHESNLSMICIVGEGMKDKVGTASTATTALADKGINISMINQGASEISMFFAIPTNQQNKAIRALYSNFFKDLHN